MLREASMMASAPPPVPVPEETVPSYETGQTTTRARSKPDSSSSAMPPKFIGRCDDSDMRKSITQSDLNEERLESSSGVEDNTRYERRPHTESASRRPETNPRASGLD